MTSDVYLGVCNAIIVIIVAIAPRGIFIALRKYPKLNVKSMEERKQYRKTCKRIYMVLKLINYSSLNLGLLNS